MPAEDRRVRDVLLVTLTASTGAVDAISWLGLGKVFSAFMTGNIAFLAIRTAGAEGPSVARVVLSLFGFGIGALVAARIVEPTRGSGGLWPHRVTIALVGALTIQAVFAAVWVAVDGRPSDPTAELLITLSALAMGMQTSAIFSLGVRAVFTTAATATWAVLMGDVSTWSSSTNERRRLASVVTALFGGAVAGALLVLHARLWAPLLPLTLSGLVIGTAAARARRPRTRGAVAGPTPASRTR